MSNKMDLDARRELHRGRRELHRGRRDRRRADRPRQITPGDPRGDATWRPPQSAADSGWDTMQRRLRRARREKR